MINVKKGRAFGRRRHSRYCRNRCPKHETRDGSRGHAQAVGARGLMLIPRCYHEAPPSPLRARISVPYSNLHRSYRRSSITARIMGLRLKQISSSLYESAPQLGWFKEFGGRAPLSYAAEHITGTDSALKLLVGVDTQVVHGYVSCGAEGAITGIGNALPREVLIFFTCAN
ncbi:MAG: hypothetical protein CM1200mP18_02680 [Gammaproteobacteria bacterium]|nr:MAG: hypothetical protein CM1200mP18_02680 [Gammaproteobacteria bacterium]